LNLIFYCVIDDLLENTDFSPDNNNCNVDVSESIQMKPVTLHNNSLSECVVNKRQVEKISESFIDELPLDDGDDDDDHHEKVNGTSDGDYGNCGDMELLITNENHKNVATNIKRQHSLRDFAREERRAYYGRNPIRKQSSLRGPFDRLSVSQCQREDQELLSLPMSRLKNGERNTLKTNQINSASSVELREISERMDVSQQHLSKAPTPLKEENTVILKTPQLPVPISPPCQFQNVHVSDASTSLTKLTNVLEATNVNDNKHKVTRSTCLKQSACEQSNTSSNMSLEKKVRYPSNLHITKDFHPDEVILTGAQSKQLKLKLMENCDFALAQEQMDMMLMSRSMSTDQFGRIAPSQIRSNRKDSPLFQTRVSNMKGSGNLNNLNRCKRKGKLHVVETSSSLGCSVKSAKTPDNNIERERKIGLSRLVDSDENCVLINEQRKQEQFVRVEESGYQSRETDSLCSSNRSTDYEDWRVFSSCSTITQGALKTNNAVGRHKSVNAATDRFQRNIGDIEAVNNNVNVLNKTARRMRYETNQMTQQQQTELVPSESSIEDTNSQDSAVQIPRIRVKSRRREP